MWKNRREQELRVEKLEDLIDTLRRFRRGQQVDRTTAEGKRVIEQLEELYGDLTVRSLYSTPASDSGHGQLGESSARPAGRSSLQRALRVCLLSPPLSLSSTSTSSEIVRERR